MTTQRYPVLIANRGEIAIRIARTCKAMGFSTVAVFSEADRFSEHVKACDQAYRIGASEPRESYLNIQKIIEVARVSGARYVHPGFGFLSEKSEFVKACEKAGLIFVGPSAEVMRQMGDKVEAKKVVTRLGIAGVPGSDGVVKNISEAKKVAEKIGFPILLKAAAGGGGKGMRRVDQTEEIDSAFEGAAREAQGAFGDASLYIEKLVIHPHHIEVQIFGDGKGGAIHLGERECSIQRRHQKVWEETPAPLLEKFPKTRETMTAAAVRIASSLRYAGAGTVEFLVDETGQFYFLEMNTRLQVEHPVTEWVTGVDLVAWQLQLAAGEFNLPARVDRRGCALEVRIYAEDSSSFLPSPGLLGRVELPEGPFLRWDSGICSGDEVSIHYDPMIAKLSVWGKNRTEALQRLRVALDETRIEPPKNAQGLKVGSLKTNLKFLRRLVRNEAVFLGETPTDLITKNPQLTSTVDAELSREAAIAVSLYQLILDSELGAHPQENIRPTHAWMVQARREGVRS